MGHGLMQHDEMFSVRKVPWHGLGKVLEEHPETVEEALTAVNLRWAVKQGDIYVAGRIPAEDEIDDLMNHPAEPDGSLFVPALEAVLKPAPTWRANIREDTGEVLGIVGDDYKVVQNEDAFRWLDALLGGDLKWETAGSLQNGKRVWMLVTPGEMIEMGGDETMPYIYCANSHDGSMAVTAGATIVRIVCENTWNMALRGAETAPRVYRFRHTGDMQVKLDEARKVMGITLNWNKAMKAMADDLARESITRDRFAKKVLRPMLGMDDPALEGRKIAIRNREEAMEELLARFDGTHPDGDTTGNSPGTKWTAANVVVEHADWGRRYTSKTDQMARSFEDQTLKQKGLDLVLAA